MLGSNNSSSRAQNVLDLYLRTLAIVSVSLVPVSVVLVLYVDTISILEMSGIAQAIVVAASATSTFLLVGVAFLSGYKYIDRNPDIARARWPTSIGQMFVGAGIAMSIRSDCFRWLLWSGLISIAVGAAILFVRSSSQNDAGRSPAFETLLVSTGIALPLLVIFSADACDVYTDVAVCNPVAALYFPFVDCTHRAILILTGVCVGVGLLYACWKRPARQVLSVVSLVSATVLGVYTGAVFIFLWGVL